MNTDRPAASWPVTTRRIALRMDVSDGTAFEAFSGPSGNQFAAENASDQ
jgi:predicted transcriptional regulator